LVLDQEPLSALWFTALDLETTGLSAGEDRIIEIAAQRFQLGQAPVSTFQTLVKPDIVISDEVQTIHHISNEMVADSPSFADIASKLAVFLKDSILLAHNASFDMTFLACELQRAGLKPLREMALDTCRLARKALPEAPNYKLSTLAEYLNLEISPSHRALPDTQACLSVFEACVKALPEKETTPLSKLIEAHPQIYVGFHEQMESSTELQVQLLTAIESHQEIQITYHNSKNKNLPRQITPLFLGGLGDYAYIEAYCHLRQSHRQFRLSRISDLTRV